MTTTSGRPTAAEFLGATPEGTGEATWRFELGPDLLGAFGGIFGGAVAASCVLAARSVAGDRRPVGLDCRFIRALPAGQARAEATIVHSGRTLTTVSVDLHDHDDRLATRALVALTDPAVLAPIDGPRVGVELPPSSSSWEPTAPVVDAPLIDTFRPRIQPVDEIGIASTLTVPWDDPGLVAEAICLVADLCVGPPVGRACAGQRLAFPNPDLSVRFAPPGPLGPDLTGVARLTGLTGGVATVAFDVVSEGSVAASGTSTTLVLPTSS